MSEHDVELHRRWIAAFNSRDVEAMISCWDPSIEYHSTFAAADGAIYHGHDGMRNWHRDLVEVWGEEIRTEAEAYFDLGEQTLVFNIFYGRGQSSGVEVAMPAAQVARRPHCLREGVRRQGGCAQGPRRIRGRAGAARSMMISADLDLVRSEAVLLTAPFA